MTSPYPLRSGVQTEWLTVPRLRPGTIGSLVELLDYHHIPLGPHRKNIYGSTCPPSGPNWSSVFRIESLDKVPGTFYRNALGCRVSYY